LHDVIDIECFLIKQFPVPDDKVRKVRLYDIEALENNHVQFLNGHLLNTMNEAILSYHSQPSGLV